MSADEKPSGRRDREKPRLTLRADPTVGFTPVTTVLTGHLTGIDLKDPNFCHPAVTWLRIDPGQTENEGFRVREDPACVHPEGSSSVETSFSKTYALSRPGAYLFRLIVEGKDGTRVISGHAKVQVLRVN
ncbi:MAG: hypothetical protein ACRD6R_00385 [Candidatus Polarisedimenticolia bacterium]